MNEILLIGFILIVNILLILLGKKLNIINIVMQLIGAIVIAPIVAIYLPNLEISKIANSYMIKIIYDICFIVLIAYILHDNIDCKYQKKDMKLVVPSFFIPFICGFFTSIMWLGELKIQSAVVFGIIFSITAVPVLYMYLKSMNYNEENTKFFIQAAVMIDIISWLAHSLVSEFHYSILLLVILSFFIAYITSKIKPQLSGIMLITILLIGSYFKSNLLLIGVIYVVTASYLKMPINLLFSDTKINQLNNYLFIPIILYIGLFKVSWNQIVPIYDYKLLLLIILPVVSKIIGNYIGLYLLKKEDKFNSSILLNTRGLTEIVFLNLVFNMKIIDSYTYVIFLIMSLICTILPVFFCKKQEK